MSFWSYFVRFTFISLVKKKKHFLFTFSPLTVCKIKWRNISIIGISNHAYFKPSRFSICFKYVFWLAEIRCFKNRLDFFFLFLSFIESFSEFSVDLLRILFNVYWPFLLIRIYVPVYTLMSVSLPSTKKKNENLHFSC